MEVLGLLKQSDIKQELKIKEEVCFELIEDESLIDGINNGNVIESEIKEVDLTQVQDVKIEQIKEEGSNDAELDDYKDSLQEEQEIDCEWSEAAENEQDPLANLDVNYNGVPLYTEGDPGKSVSLPSRKDAEDTSPAQHSLEFRVFLLNAQTGLYIQESRNLKFWFSTELPENQQATVAQDFFKELVSPQEFPRDYAAFIKKMTKLMQHKYQDIQKLVVVLQQLDQSHAIPTRPYLEFPRHKAVTVHVEEMQPSVQQMRLYKCEKCQYSSFNFVYFKKHVRRHFGTPYKCKECSYASNYQSSLERHMRVHTAKRPYKCKKCEYSCDQLSSLRRHSRIHAINRPHKCNKCEFSFANLSSLKRHIAKHSENNKKTCTECRYYCFKTHSVKKTYSCTECRYHCFKSSNFEALKKYDKIPLYKCIKCGTCFEYRKSFEQHMQMDCKKKCYMRKCEYYCLDSNDFKKHMLQTHGVKISPSSLCNMHWLQ